jgi:HEPN domain-containing protein
VTGQDDARYRLSLALRSLSTCDEELATRRWREAALFARGAIEHAAKAIVACFGTIPRTHEPAVLLDVATSDPRFPPALCAQAAAVRPALERYGVAEHQLLSYGDESARIDPWTLITEAHARESTRVARESVELAGACVAALFP